MYCTSVQLVNYECIEQLPTQKVQSTKTILKIGISFSKNVILVISYHLSVVISSRFTQFHVLHVRVLINFYHYFSSIKTQFYILTHISIRILRDQRVVYEYSTINKQLSSFCTSTMIVQLQSKRRACLVTIIDPCVAELQTGVRVVVYSYRYILVLLVHSYREAGHRRIVSWNLKGLKI